MKQFLLIFSKLTYMTYAKMVAQWRYVTLESLTVFLNFWLLFRGQIVWEQSILGSCVKINQSKYNTAR